MSSVLSFAVIAFVAFNAVSAVRDRRESPGWRMLRHLRPRHVGWGLLSLTGTAVGALLLTSIPGLDWGWWQLLSDTGSPITGQSDATTTGLASIVPAAMLLLLLAAIPPLAYAEERAFRHGSQHRPAASRFRIAVAFGLVHLVMGIPVGVALALTFAGLVFTHSYLRGYRKPAGDVAAGPDARAAMLPYVRSGQPIPDDLIRQLCAVQESTLVHIAHNYAFLALLATALFWG